MISISILFSEYSMDRKSVTGKVIGNFPAKLPRQH